MQRTLPRLRPSETRLKDNPRVSGLAKLTCDSLASAVRPATSGNAALPNLSPSAFLPQAAISLPLSHPSVLSGVNLTLPGPLRSRDTSSLMSQGKRGLRDLYHGYNLPRRAPHSALYPHRARSTASGACPGTSYKSALDHSHPWEICLF